MTEDEGVDDEQSEPSEAAAEDEPLGLDIDGEAVDEARDLEELLDSIESDPIEGIESLESELDTASGPEPGTSNRFDALLSRVEAREGDTADSGVRKDVYDLTAIPGVADADSVLLVGPLGTPADDRTCLSAFDRVSMSNQRVLLVTISPRGRTRLEVFLDERDAAEPIELAHVGRAERRSDLIRTVELNDPSDLARLGISIDRILSDWNESGEISVCLHSLSALLQRIDEERLFRFVHVLLGRLEGEGSQIHVHMDADSHSPRVVGLYRELFDVTIGVTENGLEVRSSAS